MNGQQPEQNQQRQGSCSIVQGKTVSSRFVGYLNYSSTLIHLLYDAKHATKEQNKERSDKN